MDSGQLSFCYDLSVSGLNAVNMRIPSALLEALYGKL
jgi:hypothetical protein